MVKLEIVFDCLKLFIELARLSLFSSKKSSKNALILPLILDLKFFASSSSYNLDFLIIFFFFIFVLGDNSKAKVTFLFSDFSSFSFKVFGSSTEQILLFSCISDIGVMTSMEEIFLFSGLSNVGTCSSTEGIFLFSFLFSFFSSSFFSILIPYFFLKSSNNCMKK